MNTTLSMPSTISSALRVMSANQACGSVMRSSIGSRQAAKQSRRDHVEPDGAQRAGDPGTGSHFARDGDERKCPPGGEQGDVQGAPAGDPQRMDEGKRHEGQDRERG